MNKTETTLSIFAGAVVGIILAAVFLFFILPEFIIWLAY